MTLIWRFNRDCDEQGAERRTNSLAGLAVTLLLVCVGLYLVDTLRAQGQFQDCVLSGRSACEVVSR